MLDLKCLTQLKIQSGLSRVVHHLPKNAGNLGHNVNGRTEKFGSTDRKKRLER